MYYQQKSYDNNYLQLHMYISTNKLYIYTIA